VTAVVTKAIAKLTCVRIDARILVRDDPGG
jgi:hypothetical protein